MSTELDVIPSSALTEQEQADLNASIDSIIAAHKNNRQEINRLVFESVSAMTDSEGYECKYRNQWRQDHQRASGQQFDDYAE